MTAIYSLKAGYFVYFYFKIPPVVLGFYDIIAKLQNEQSMLTICQMPTSAYTYGPFWPTALGSDNNRLPSVCGTASLLPKGRVPPSRLFDFNQYFLFHHFHHDNTSYFFYFIPA